MWKLYTTKMSRTSYEMITYNPKEDESIVTIEMRYRRAWIDQGMGVSKVLNIIWEGILMWQRCKLMRYLFGY